MKKKVTLLIPVFLLVWIIISKYETGTGRFGAALEEYLAETVSRQTTDIFLPVFAFAGEEAAYATAAGMLGSSLLKEVPLYSYCGSGTVAEAPPEDDTYDYEAILEAEGQDEHFDKIEEENEDRQEELDQIRQQEQTDEMNLEQMFLMENENIQTDSFVPGVKLNGFDWESMKNYETFVSTFYAIDSTTMAGSDQLNVEALLSRNMTISKEDPAPQILIYHTHSKEGFIDSAEGDPSQTIVGVGDKLAQILTEQYGYSVLHHTAEYDTVRDKAYAKSLPEIEQLLKENPSIEVIIDLHRDAGAQGRHLAVDIGGRPTARFMFFNGLSRTKKTGDIEYLANPNLADNLALSFQMQVAAGEYYPGLTRKIYLKGYRYNMHLLPRTLLIELGDSNNTVEEAMNAADPLAHILDLVLSGQQAQ